MLGPPEAPSAPWQGPVQSKDLPGEKPLKTTQAAPEGDIGAFGDLREPSAIRSQAKIKRRVALRRKPRPRVAPNSDGKPGATTGDHESAPTTPTAEANTAETETPSGNTAGAPWNLRGRIFSDIYVPTTRASENTYPYIATAAWLQADPKFDERTFGNLILETNVVEAAESGSGGPTTRSVNVDLREAYLAYADAGWDLRIGRQIIPWGKSDIVNPTDFLSAKDFTRFNPDDEIKRIGATSVKTSWTPKDGSSPLTFSAVWTPIFPKSRLLIPVASIPTNVRIGPSNEAPTNLSASEVGLKATYFAPSWDVSLLGFRGWNHLPEFVFSSATATEVTVASSYHQIRAFGLDFSKTAEDWVFRGEGAYVWTENNDGLNPQIQPTHIDAVLGVEKAFGDSFRIQVQGILRHHPNYLSPDETPGATPNEILINRGIAVTNALVLGYQHKTREGATVRVSYISEQSGWEFDALGLMYFNDQDYLIRPKVTRAWTDTFKTSVGVDHHGGPERTQLGALTGYNSLFLEAKFSY